MSLLEDARKLNTSQGRAPKKYTRDDEELVIAWMAEEVSLTQVARVKKLATVTHAYCYIAQVARQMYRNSNGAK